MQTAEDNFFRKKHTTSVAYLVGLLLFFLPFVQIKCNDMPFAENTGMGLAFGTDYKVTNGLNSLQGGFGNGDRDEAPTKEKGKMYVLALLALVLGVAGLGISLSNMRSGPSINLVIGILAALCMIILMFQISADVKGETNKPDRVSDFTDSVKVTVNYTFWFYLSVCSFLAAAFFSYKHKQLAVVPEEPSKETPQLDLQDRTDQSEFPRAASEPEIG
jgi:hypothetical protein